jgi:hypothetical protein
MEAQKESVGCRSVQAAKVIDQDQQGTKKSFIEQKHRCGNGRPARPVASCGATPAPNQKNGYKHKRHTARYSVREFDYRLGLRSRGEKLAVAERPVTAATRSGSSCAHIGAPDDDGDVVRNDEPREASERGSPDLGNACARRISVDDTSTYEFVTCISSRRNSLHNHLSLDAAIRPSRRSLFLIPGCQQYCPGLSHRPEAMRTFGR